MPKYLMDKIKVHIRENILSYIILSVFFILGIIFGAYIATTYNSDQVKYLNDFLSDVIKIFQNDSLNYNEIFKVSLFSSLKTLLFIWLLGFTVLGVAVILFMMVKCGFMLGFISTFLISLYSFKGAVAAFFIILAQSVFYIPALFIISTYGLSFSSILIKMITGKIKYKANFKYYIMQYSVVALILAFVMILYSLCEAYVVANLLRWLTTLN